MNLRIRNISTGITVLTYVVLALFIIVSVINYSKPLQPGPFYLPTISELIDDSPTNGFIYLMFVTTYGTIKVALIAMSLLDAEVLHSELIEKKKGVNRSTPRSRRVFVVMSVLTGLLAAFQLVAMIILVFFPISKVYKEHFTVAALAFGSAMVKSFFLLIRRKLLYDINSNFYMANIIYYIGFVSSFIGFYYTRYGYVEYILVVFILFENVFLTVEFYNLTFSFSISMEDEKTGDLQPIKSTFSSRPLERAKLLEKWAMNGI